MQDTAGTWLMTSLTGSPLLIALMQTAASLPVLFLGFVAGATADIFDRRRLLVFWQTWMLSSVALLSILTLAGIVSPWTLLSLTFLLNIGNALNGPAWQAIVPELVPRTELPEAVAINSVGFNLSRAVGPALGGLMVAAFATAVHGAGIVFVLNALSFVGVILVLFLWQRKAMFKSALPAERLAGSLRAGVRYILHAPPLQATFVRVFAFTLFASAVWALLAVVAQQDLHQGAMGYGLLNGCLGVGAITGAALLPKVRKRLDADRIVTISSLVFVGTLLILALVHRVPVIVIALLATGMAWTSTTSSLNIAVQISVPAWVQARALGAYQTIFWAGMALGSWAWGDIAEHFATWKSLLVAAAGMLLVQPVVSRFHLGRGAPPDMSPFQPLRGAPTLEVEPEPDDGPVLVSIEYLVEPEDYESFTRAIHRFGHVRLRDGASRWGVFRDTARPERIVEQFVTESWLEFLRERERMTESDRKIRDRVRRYHRGEEPPKASFMIYAREVRR
jgi:MFS family permease